MKINKANDTAVADIVSGLGEGVGNANPISAAINAVSDIGKAIASTCADVAKTAHEAFTNALSINADILKNNKVEQESNTGLYIVMGVLFVGVILVASLRTKKK